MKKLNTKKTVKKLLYKNPKLRDSDPKLIARYWFNELQTFGIDPHKITAYELLCKVAASGLTSTETIRRMRCKIQEEHELLRGQKYITRKGKLQNEWKKSLGYGHY